MEKSDFHSKYDRQSLKNVRGDYDVMKTLIGSLSSKLSNVSSHIEKEFLSAYRVHMLSVQEELRDLKNQVTDAEVALNDDEEVSRLEHEVTWFSDEATRLRNQSNSMKKDMYHVTSRIDALREQQLYLNEQLKTTLKRSRIIEAELSIMPDKASNCTTNSFEPTKQQQDFDTFDDGEYIKQSARSFNRVNGSDALQSISKVSKVLPHSQTINSSLPNIKPQFKAKKDVPNDILLAKKGDRTTWISSLSPIEELRQLEESRLQMEIDLESALKSVFSEIIDRKVKAVERTSKNKSDSTSSWKIDASAGGLTGLGLAHFSDTDRLSAISAFLGTPHIFRKITETLGAELEL